MPDTRTDVYSRITNKPIQMYDFPGCGTKKHTYKLTPPYWPRTRYFMFSPAIGNKKRA